VSLSDPEETPQQSREHHRSASGASHKLVAQSAETADMRARATPWIIWRANEVPPRPVPPSPATGDVRAAADALARDVVVLTQELEVARAPEANNHHVFASFFVIGVVTGFALGVIFQALVG
jgi:hypothetical protein